VFGRIPANVRSTESSRYGPTFLHLDKKAEKQGLARDRHWPLRVSELAEVLLNGHGSGAYMLKDRLELARPDHAALVKYLA